MYLQEGKNVEAFLAGKVEHPLDEAKFMREIRGGVGRLRRLLKRTLKSTMEQVRRDQKEKNPSTPKSYFAKNLVADLDEALGSITDIEDGERYDIRFYSAVGTKLDFSGSFDCWVELYDKKKKKVLADVKIDITTNPNKKAPSNLADIVLYFNDNLVDPYAKGQIEPRFFRSFEYKNLIEQSAQIITKRANIRFKI